MGFWPFFEEEIRDIIMQREGKPLSRNSFRQQAEKNTTIKPVAIKKTELPN